MGGVVLRRIDLSTPCSQTGPMRRPLIPIRRPRKPWNVNIHYDRLLDRCVPTTARRVLDVGCGDGFLAAQLSGRVREVVALDADSSVLDRARARFPDADIDWQHGDVLTAPLAPRSFDAVVSNATLHHLPDTAAALRRLAELVHPGGTLAIVGLPRRDLPELPWNVVTFVARGVALRVRGKWDHTAPVIWPPKDTLRQVKGSADATLPGAKVRRLGAWPISAHL